MKLCLLHFIFLLLLASTACTATAQTITIFAGGMGAGYGGDGGPATAAYINYPVGVASDDSGNVYFAESGNSCIRKVNTSGIITTIAGIGGIPGGYNGDNMPATDAQLYSPSSIAIDSRHNIYIADVGNYRIRKIDTLGIITTIAGTGASGFSGEGGPASACSLDDAIGVAVDKVGNVYIGDLGNNRLRKIDTLGIITTIAGTGIYGLNTDSGVATTINMAPGFLAIDTTGNIYMTEYDQVRKLNISGISKVIAGMGVPGYSGDGGPAKNALLNGLTNLFIDDTGNVYISEIDNNDIRKVNLSGIITTIFLYETPEGFIIYPDGSLILADGIDSRIIKASYTEGVYPQSINNHIHIFPNPNPAKNSMVITCPDVGGQIVIMNSVGITLFKRSLKASENYVSADVTAWADGLYIIKWQGEDGTVLVNKFIKN